MPKRKRYPKLPNGWGSIRYLGKDRRNPYAVHPPATERKPDGQYIRPKALCYVPSWLVGFAVLNAYRAGTYKPGDEIALSEGLAPTTDERNLDDYVRRIIADSNRHTRAGTDTDPGPTFKQVFGLAFEWKTGEHAPRKLSASTKNGITSAFARLAAVHDVPIKMIRIDDLQTIFNECPLGKTSRQKMKEVCMLTYKYAMQRKLINDDVSQFIVIPSDAKEPEHGIPFCDTLLSRLWDNRNDPDCELMLILCYSGHRIGETKTVTVDLAQKTFNGGIKTEAGRNRVVPIHSAILPLVEKRIARDGALNTYTYSTASRHFAKAIKKYWPECPTHHTPHDTRHTFNMLAEHYGISEVDRKRLLGHALPGVTNAVYGHRSLDDLRIEIEKIQVPWL